MVNLTTFKKKHIKVLNEMRKAYNLQEIGNDLPKIGFIAFSNSEYQYVAIGFLRMVEGNLAQMDGFITNPELSGDIRNEGINLIVKSLIEKAKSLKLKAIYAFTVDESILMRAEDTGFTVKDYKVITLPL